MVDNVPTASQANPVLNRAALERIQRYGTRTDVPAGTIVVQQGEAMERFLVVANGELAVEQTNRGGSTHVLTHALVLETKAPGGQAGSSSRIENYLGFPNGLSGPELARRAFDQAEKFGAELLMPDLPKYEGVGIYYGASSIEAQMCAGTEVVVVGGGNSAGQAAVFLTAFAHHVHILIRGAHLADTMSKYLI